MPKKINSAYKTISEVLEILNSNINTQKKNELHTIRFWEKQFKQLNPKRINNRRYYDNKNIDTLLKIQFLLKNQGMTINGVKKILNNPNYNGTLNLDEISNNSIRNHNLKNKVLNISKIVKILKNYK